jgi:hypothetical protein
VTTVTVPVGACGRASLAGNEAHNRAEKKAIFERLIIGFLPGIHISGSKVCRYLCNSALDACN